VLEHKAVDAARRAEAEKRGAGQVKVMRDLYNSTVSELNLADRDPTPSQHLQGAELWSALVKAVSTLNKQERRILYYSRVCGMSYEEIMPHLTMLKDGKPVLDEDGKPVPVTKVGTAKSMLSRAKQKLRKLLKEQGLIKGHEGAAEEGER